jgi:hypothetical protein
MDTTKKQTITCIVRDNHRHGYPDPLIYVVDVCNPDNHDEVLKAVTESRRADLGGDDKLDLTILFAFSGDLDTVSDWRE